MNIGEKFMAGFVGFLLLVTVFFSVFSYQYVEPGHVGIVVDLYGSQKGVQDIPVKTGYVWYNRWLTNVYKYPTFVQRAVFTQDLQEDSPIDESITFNSKEGIVLRADVGLHYLIPQEKAPNVFVRLRGDETIVRSYLKSRMRDAINSIASNMTINEIYGEGKNRLLKEAQTKLQESLHDEIQIELLTFVNALILPDNVVNSINLTIQAQQTAIAAQNKVAQSKAEADQKIEDARGRAESVLLEANKQAEANLTLAKSLTPELVRWQALQKWDGRLPSVTGGGTIPFVDVTPATK